MVPYKSLIKSTNDENIKTKSKTSSHTTSNDGSNKREVLSDVTQLNENVDHRRKSSADILKQQSVSKLHINKVHSNQLKKQRLGKLLSSSHALQLSTGSSTNNEDTDNEEYDDYSVTNKENEPPLHTRERSHSDEYLIEKKRDVAPRKEVEERFEAQGDHSHTYESPEVHTVDNIGNLEVFDSDDGIENASTVKSNCPMEPKWNKSIFNELQNVMKGFTRDSLDENDEDTYDITMVAEYAPEIFNYMHELEHKLLPDANYMDNQDELRWEMRSVLIDWVVQVHTRFNLLPETLYLSVNYIDRFLSKRKVSLSRFQLVGAVALFIAAKYEEINCPTVQEVAYMADNAYSIDDFLKAERFMIDVLEFDMGWPGPMSFLRRTSKADDYDYETRTLAKYLLEVTIMDHRLVASPPSWLAAGAHYLSRHLLDRGEWTDAHIFYSGYTEVQLRPLVVHLLQSCRDAETHHKAIFEKYQERRYRRSSTFVQEFIHSLERSQL